MDPLLLAAIVGIATTLVLFSGIPVGIGLILVSIGFIVIFDGTGSLPLLPEILFGKLESFEVLAIPMFILMGAVVASSRAGGDLYSVLDRWLTRVPGGLVISNLGACAIFSALSGSSPATCAAIGKMLDASDKYVDEATAVWHANHFAVFMFGRNQHGGEAIGILTETFAGAGGAGYFGSTVVLAVLGAAGGDRQVLLLDLDADKGQVEQSVLWRWKRTSAFDLGDVDRVYVWSNRGLSLRLTRTHMVAITFEARKPLSMGQYHTSGEAMAMASRVGSFLDVPIRRNEKPRRRKET